jgi:Ca2+-binding EF-hand superfamily protein
MLPRVITLLLVVLMNSALLSQQPVHQLAPQKILRLLGADGKTDHEETYLRVFRFLDDDRDNILSWEEYVVHGRYGNPTMRGAIFRITDKDQDDSISLEEYLYNRHVTDEAKELLGLADANKDGYLSRAEFLEHPQIKKEKTAGRIFDMLDQNRDGWLDPREYLFTWQTWMNSLPSGWNQDGEASSKPAGKGNRQSKNTTRGKSW